MLGFSDLCPYIHHKHANRDIPIGILSLLRGCRARVIGGHSLLYSAWKCTYRCKISLCLFINVKNASHHSTYFDVFLSSKFYPSHSFSITFFYITMKFTLTSNALTTVLLAGSPVFAAWKGFDLGSANSQGACKTTGDYLADFKKIKSWPNGFNAVRLYSASDCNSKS